jgi:hypothetical protein
MFDDFWSGYNYGTPRQRPYSNQQMQQIKKQMYNTGSQRVRQQQTPGMYDKTKAIRMSGPNGEQGEIYANGKMYIIDANGKSQARTFPSRPYGIKYMQVKFGWELI